MLIFRLLSLFTFSILIIGFNIPVPNKFFLAKYKLNASNPKNSKEKIVVAPEFSRVVNIASLPGNRAVVCKLLAKEKERVGLSERFNIHEIPYFSANVTIQRESKSAITVQGVLEAHVKYSDFISEHEVITADFETLILDSITSANLNFEEATEYDDEVGPNGDIDIGEISAQYLALELF